MVKEWHSPGTNTPRYSIPKIEPLAVLIAAVCMAIFAVHWPALSAQAISFDDSQYLINNELVQSPGWTSAWRFVTEILEPSTVRGYYQPLAMISLMLDYALGGRENNLMPFHRTSLILHVANSALIIVLLYLLFGQIWIAAGVGLLFGVHPMTVEPIPWVGERKTLLAAFFSLWSLILYVYPRVTSPNRQVTKFYIGSFVMYLLALMSKPTSTPLPAVMLLMDYWPLHRLNWRAVLEKVPFFVLGGISAFITYISQSRTASTILPSRFGPTRIPLILCHNIFFYLYKMIRPVNLSSHYPFPNPLNLSQPMVLAGVIGTFLLILLLLLSLRWTRAALTGWLIFFVAILPTMQIIGFTNVIASDKFAYLPSIGLLMILTAFLSWLSGAFGVHKAAVRKITAIIIVLMLAGAESVATRCYLVHWSNSVNLYEYMLKLTPNSAPLHNGLGGIFQLKGDLDEAINHYHQALRIEPAYNDARYNLATALKLKGDINEAIGQFRQVLQLRPNHVEAHTNLAEALLEQGKLNEAVRHYRQAIQLKPHNSVFQYNLAAALASAGVPNEAINFYNRALQLNPNNVKAHNNLGTVLKSQGKLEQAVSHYRQAVRLKPDYVEAYNNLGNALRLQGKLDEAVDYLRRALALNPNIADIHYNLGLALQSLNEPEEAMTRFRQAIRIKPDWPSPLDSLASLLATTSDPRLRDPNEAIVLAQRAVELSQRRNASILDTLASAYAAAGRFNDAITTAQTALDLAAANHNEQLAAQIGENLQLYKQQKSR